MKKLAFALLFTLGGCSTLGDIWNPPKFDNQEYAAIVTLRQAVQHKEMCAAEEQAGFAKLLMFKFEWLQEYSEFTSHNSDVYKISTTMKQESEALLSRAETNPSEMYCEGKLKVMEQQLIILQKAVATKG